VSSLAEDLFTFFAELVVARASCRAGVLLVRGERPAELVEGWGDSGGGSTIEGTGKGGEVTSWGERGGGEELLRF
jgi:hypothetical protein